MVRSKRGGPRKSETAAKKDNDLSNKGKDPAKAVEVSSSVVDYSDSEEEPNTFIVPKPKSIIVGNLSDKVNADQLRFHFNKAGKIKEYRLDTFKDGTCRGSGQVEFYTDEEVEAACKLNGTELGGRAITVNFGHERAIRTDSRIFFHVTISSGLRITSRGFKRRTNPWCPICHRRWSNWDLLLGLFVATVHNGVQKDELKKMAKQLEKLVDLKKQSNLLAAIFYLCAIVLGVVYLLFISQK